MDKQYDVSVIIPVYNVVEYLEETIDSVVRQTIGFENIELILVNDGSTDGSESICLKYKEMFPDNVVYVKQKNAGVSVARNNGLKHAHGRYINFLDSDDKWDEKAFEKGVKLLEENLDMMVAIYPICFFDASVGKHPLNYVNEENKVIDIRKNYDCIQLSSCSCLFRASALEGRQYFDKLKISEDARLITEIFLDYPVNYAISGVYYRYRKRTDQSSTIQTSQKSKSWYLDTPKYCYQYLIDLSKEKYNEVIKYVQFLIIYDLHWRLNVSPDETLTKEETKEYYNLIKEIMDNLDDKLIASFPMMNVQEKLYFLNYKYHSCSIYQLKDHNLCIGKNIICSEEYMPITINNIYTEKDMAFIYGRMPLINGVLSDVYLLDESDHKIPFEHYELDKGTKTLLHLKNDVNCPMVGIKAVVDLSKHHTFALYGTNGTQTYRVNFTMSYTCQLSNCFYGLYLRSEHYYLKHDSKKIMISKKSALQKVKLETACLFKMLCQRRFKSFVYRVCALGYHLFHRKPIWIVSDRINAGEDNGQAFFEYLNTIKPKNIKYYFAIDKKCHDGQKLSAKYKNVIQHASFKHRILHLNASKIISAQADNYVTNLFGKGKNYVGDLYRFQFVFLQHGIIKDDLSPWLNINNRVINMFVTSAIPEYESIAGTEYCYNFPPEWIKLTGLARYDKLLDDNVERKKQILVMPSWRRNLTSAINTKTGERLYNKSFKKTEYFKFYNDLLNDERLLKALKKYGYKVRFIPHINMRAQIGDFSKNEYVEIVTEDIIYNQEFKANSLLVTDFSSVVFDFVYLKKPVVYSQFDKKSFYEGQIYDQGYFDYEKDGFGPVTETLDDTVNAIIRYLENDCHMEEKYSKRIDKFYKYRDQNNCKRTYEEIIKLDKK